MKETERKNWKKNYALVVKDKIITLLESFSMEFSARKLTEHDFF